MRHNEEKLQEMGFDPQQLIISRHKEDSAKLLIYYNDIYTYKTNSEKKKNKSKTNIFDKVYEEIQSKLNSDSISLYFIALNSANLIF